MDILGLIDSTIGGLCADCDGKLPLDGASGWWCTEGCQESWQKRRARVEPLSQPTPMQSVRQTQAGMDPIGRQIPNPTAQHSRRQPRHWDGPTPGCLLIPFVGGPWDGCLRAVPAEYGQIGGGYHVARIGNHVAAAFVESPVWDPPSHLYVFQRWDLRIADLRAFCESTPPGPWHGQGLVGCTGGTDESAMFDALSGMLHSGWWPWLLDGVRSEPGHRPS